jgi:hypothetical protein
MPSIETAAHQLRADRDCKSGEMDNRAVHLDASVVSEKQYSPMKNVSTTERVIHKNLEPSLRLRFVSTDSKKKEHGPN